MAPENNTGEQLGFSSHSMTAMRRKNKQQKIKAKQNKTKQPKGEQNQQHQNPKPPLFTSIN